MLPHTSPAFSLRESHAFPTVSLTPSHTSLALFLILSHAPDINSFAPFHNSLILPGSSRNPLITPPMTPTAPLNMFVTVSHTPLKNDAIPPNTLVIPFHIVEQALPIISVTAPKSPVMIAFITPTTVDTIPYMIFHAPLITETIPLNNPVTNGPITPQTAWITFHTASTTGTTIPSIVWNTSPIIVATPVNISVTTGPIAPHTVVITFHTAVAISLITAHILWNAAVTPSLNPSTLFQQYMNAATNAAIAAIINPTGDVSNDIADDNKLNPVLTPDIMLPIPLIALPTTTKAVPTTVPTVATVPIIPNNLGSNPSIQVSTLLPIPSTLLIGSAILSYTAIPTSCNLFLNIAS